VQYIQCIARKRPGLLVFLIDQSKSMEERYGADPASPSKAAALADVLNKCCTM